MAGFISITTGPLLVSRVSMSPAPLISSLPSFRLGGHAHRHDLIRVRDLAVVLLRPSLDLVDDIHAGHDFAEGGVLAIEEARVAEADEELRIGRVRIVRARHPDNPTLEVCLIKFGWRVG